MKNKLTFCAALVAALAAGGAHAQTAGTWMLGVGATQISPNVKSGNLTAPSSPGTQIDARSDTEPSAWVTYMVTNNISVEVPIAPAFKHEFTGAGAIAGVGKVGTVRVLPATVFAQYRFMEPNAKWRPYVELGVTYAHFYGARGSATLNAINPLNPAGGTGLSVDSKWGVTPGIGVTFALTDKVFADVQYSHTFIKTTAHLSTGQSISTKLDPDTIKVGVGMKF
jgi:outer membrane protein